MQTKIFLAFFFLFIINFSLGDEILCNDLICTNTYVSLVWLKWASARDAQNQTEIWKLSVDRCSQFKQTISFHVIDCEKTEALCLPYTNRSVTAHVFFRENITINVCFPQTNLEAEANQMEVLGKSFQKIFDYFVYWAQPKQVWPQLKGTEINEETFDDAIKEGNVIVNFFQSLCPHCLKIKGWYNQLQETFANDPRKIKFYFINCDEGVGKDFCYFHDSKRFPTVLLYRDGKRITEYPYGPTVREFQMFIDEQLGK